MKAYTLSLIALALTSSLAQAATADLVLDKVVTLNRHGTGKNCLNYWLRLKQLIIKHCRTCSSSMK